LIGMTKLCRICDKVLQTNSTFNRFQRKGAKADSQQKKFGVPRLRGQHRLKAALQTGFGSSVPSYSGMDFNWSPVRTCGRAPILHPLSSIFDFPSLRIWPQAERYNAKNATQRHNAS
jgi:hypothetical protein